MPSLSIGQTSGANKSWRRIFLLVHTRFPLDELVTRLLVVAFLEQFATTSNKILKCGTLALN
jgi:hypothetical protein